MPMMKRKYMLMFGAIFYLISLVVLALLVYYSDDSILWQESLWSMTYQQLIVFLFYLTVPFLLFAIFLGIWIKNPEPKCDTPPPSRHDEPEVPMAPPSEPHGINCPNCDRWFPAQAHICPECELPVENMARMSQVKKRFLDGRLTREQYEEVVRKLVG